MAKVSQNTKYVKLDDGVSFALVRTNPKLTTNTKLMYNGKKMYMESYASSELLNRTMYKNVSVKQKSTYNRDIANFLRGSGSQAYRVYKNFSDVAISSSYDNQFETLYWCGAEYIDSSFYTEEIGFIAPLYLREKRPNYFLIFRIDSPSNYNLNIDEYGKPLDSTFDFKRDILDKAVLIKTFDLREGTVLGNYINNYIEQELFEFDKSMYVNFSNCEVTYYGINKANGVLEKKVESFESKLLKDNPILKEDEWFTEGFERNGLIFPYIMNIEYLFDDDNFKHNGEETYDFARYIGVYCNNIEFGEFEDLDELEYTEENAIYYFEDNKNNLHRYSKSENDFKIDGKDAIDFDRNLISGFEKERINGYAEPLDIYEGFENRAQYAFEIVNPLEPGDWVGIEYNGYVECYFADSKKTNNGEKYGNFRFYVDENSSLNDIAESLAKCVNHNKKSKFEAKYSNNVVVFYAKREGVEYNGSADGGAKILIDASLIYNKKISIPYSDNIEYVDNDDISNCRPIEHISDSDNVYPVPIYNEDRVIIGYEKSSFGNYYIDYFSGACDVVIDEKTELYKNIFKIYENESVLFKTGRYLKTNNGDGREILANIAYINAEGEIEYDQRIIIVNNAPEGVESDVGYDISVSSTCQVEIMDKFKPNHGVLSWFPVKDFDFDINYSTYGQYGAFVDECNMLSKKITYTELYNLEDTADSDYETTQEKSISGLRELAKSPFFDDYGESLGTEYDYYFEQTHPDLCLMSKTAPYISKWGYYDEQKDSCENPYRLNVNKVFGTSNLSANTYLRRCDENEYTHSMPYYVTLDVPNYYKDYQYIASDDIYRDHHMVGTGEGENAFKNFDDCIDYWVNGVFMRTDIDMFSYFFSGKKYGNRFDRKYSRILGGDKFHNPSTLFRGVKFEVIRQYNGVEKRSSEYNDYKFSFVYIPVMLDTIVFSEKVYFVKNDTFKFIVGMVFVNTMLGLGAFRHNIFGGNVNYFNKGFLYGACKDIIRPENSTGVKYKLDLNIGDKNFEKDKVFNDFWENVYDVGEKENKFYMWICEDGWTYDDDDDSSDGGDKTAKTKQIILTKDRLPINKDNEIYTIGEFNIENENNITDAIDAIVNGKKYTIIKSINDDTFTVSVDQYYEGFDAHVYGYKTFNYYGIINVSIDMPQIEFKDLSFIETCDVDWQCADDEDFSKRCTIDVSKLHIKSESLQNILINMGVENSIAKIILHCKNNSNDSDNEISNIFENGDNSKYEIKVDIIAGNISISDKTNADSDEDNIKIEYVNINIEDVKMDIVINDIFNENYGSLGFKDYFSVFEQVSMYNMNKSINDDYNVKYYSTIEDNKYKIKVIEPDSIEIEDRYEAIPTKITENNKNVLGSIVIKEKMNVDKIGIKVINRYSGFYNPIFNDILFYGDYTYTKSVGRLKNAERFEMPYSNTYIDYNYNDGYGTFGVIKNMYFHKTNVTHSDVILTSDKKIYPLINEYALDYRDYNIFSSSWDEGYFISQDDLYESSICGGIGSMKDGKCMFGSKYLNLPDYIFVDTFENGVFWDEKMSMGLRDITDVEIIYKEINNRSVKYQLFIEKRLKRHLKEKLMDVFSKYINKKYSFGNKGTIEDDVEEYVEKNLLKLYAVDKVYMYIKSEPMRINDKHIENEYLKYVSISNELKIKNGFPIISNSDDLKMKESPFSMQKINEFDRIITYNLKSGFKESFGFAVSFRRK